MNGPMSRFSASYLEYQSICLLIITYFKPVQPFPFDKYMKRFDTCIIPWESLFRVAALHFCSKLWEYPKVCVNLQTDVR